MKTKKLIRKIFRDSVFLRDDFKCVYCNDKHNLVAHHITDRNEMPNGGYVKENGITLCPTCHIKAETFHNSQGIMWEENMHPMDLYKKIHSSYEKAYKQSLK
jgi:5-methylcytosine-specific restriction endonuclease McrA